MTSLQFQNSPLWVRLCRERSYRHRVDVWKDIECRDFGRMLAVCHCHDAHPAKREGFRLRFSDLHSKTNTHPIDDEDAPHLGHPLAEQLGRNGDRVEETEAHGQIGLRMMARRPDNGESIPQIPLGRLQRQIDHTSGGHSCCGGRMMLIPRGIQIHTQTSAR